MLIEDFGKPLFVVGGELLHLRTGRNPIVVKLSAEAIYFLTPLITLFSQRCQFCAVFGVSPWWTCGTAFPALAAITSVPGVHDL